eukprot:SAG31_NODE_3987_length_3683_cov_4.328962_3_plen_114_part_00
MLDRLWYTPATAKALARPDGRLGSAPFLALVTDADASRITAAAIMGHDAMGERAASELAAEIPEHFMWFGRSSDGWGRKKSSFFKTAAEAEEIEAVVDNEEEEVAAAAIEDDY